MNAFVGVTDGDRFELLASIPDPDEVKFWQQRQHVHAEAARPAPRRTGERP